MYLSTLYPVSRDITTRSTARINIVPHIVDQLVDIILSVMKIMDTTQMMDALGTYSADVCRIIYTMCMQMKVYSVWPPLPYFRKQMRRVIGPCEHCGLRDSYLQGFCVVCHCVINHPHSNLMDVLLHCPEFRRHCSGAA